MSNSLGHLPRFMRHRQEIAADGAGVPNIPTLKTRGYEQIAFYHNPDTAHPSGTCDLEVYLHDADNDIWFSIFTQAAAVARKLYFLDTFGGDIRIAARNLGGGAVAVSIFASGMIPERSFGD